MTCRSDLFSLGITIFFCATGRFPFCKATANDVTIIFRLTTDQAPAEPLEINEDGAAPILTQGLAMIVSKALKKRVPRATASGSSATAQPEPSTHGYPSANAMLTDVRTVQRCPNGRACFRLWLCGVCARAHLKDIYIHMFFSLFQAHGGRDNDFVAIWH